MDKVILYKDENGQILQATGFEPVDRDDLIEQIDEARDTLRKLQAALARYDSLTAATPGTDSEEKTTLRGIEDENGRIHFTKEPAQPPQI